MGHSNGPKYATAAAATNNGLRAAMPVKKPAPAPAVKSQQKDNKAKDNGSWGPLFKNKDNFRSMHMY